MPRSIFRCSFRHQHHAVRDWQILRPRKIPSFQILLQHHIPKFYKPGKLRIICLLECSKAGQYRAHGLENSEESERAEGGSTSETSFEAHVPIVDSLTRSVFHSEYGPEVIESFERELGIPFKQETWISDMIKLGF